MLRCGTIATLLVAWFLGSTCLAPAYAQDAHYWNLQYGTRAELLGGLVIGSKVGLSNTYYNPGALGLLDRPSLVLSSLAFELTSITLPQAAPDKAVHSTRLSAVPNFVAGTLWFGVLGGSKLAYSFLTRQDFDVRLSLRAATTLPGAGGAPDTVRAGEILSEANVGENWFGLTWSKPLAAGLGFGLTQYIAYRGQRSRSQLVGQEAVVGGPGLGAHYVDEFNYWHIRTLMKLGALFERDDYSLGVTATTPSLGIMGSGSVFTVLHDPVLTPNAPTSAANFQEDLKPDYQSEWALGAGASYQYKSTRVHASLEWYQAIARREVMPSDSFLESSTGKVLNNSAIQELDAVTNYGIGVEHTLSATVQLYASYITNFSALPDETDANMAFSSWDIYQLTGGSNFTLKGVEFTLGLEYGFGSNTVDRLQFTEADAAPLVFGEGAQEVRFRRWEAFLGFTFLFGDDPNAAPSQTLGQRPEGG